MDNNNSNKRPIYLDYMSTTPVDPAVIEKMKACLGQNGCFGNAASQTHCYGFEAAACVERARKQVADLIHAEPREIVWTSGATESNNLAIQGAAHFYKRQGRHIITMSTEHKAVLDTCAFLELQGFKVTYLKPKKNGLLNIEDLTEAIKPDTILISIMAVNNETWVIQDIAKIGKISRKNGILLHVDGAQSAGKIPMDVKKLNVDLLSLTAHKVYGPKGIGALYVSRTPFVRLEPLVYGGGHERGLRSGTLPIHQIVGMGEAFAIAKNRLQKDTIYISNLRQHLWKGLLPLQGIHLNGDLNKHIPGCLNIYFECIDGESLLTSLTDIAISGGSACNSASPEPSHVLVAMGLPTQTASNALRISIGRYTTTEQIDRAIVHIKKQVTRLRSISPVWHMVKNEINTRIFSYCHKGKNIHTRQ